MAFSVILHSPRLLAFVLFCFLIDAVLSCLITESNFLTVSSCPPKTGIIYNSSLSPWVFSWQQQCTFLCPEIPSSRNSDSEMWLGPIVIPKGWNANCCSPQLLSNSINCWVTAGWLRIVDVIVNKFCLWELWLLLISIELQASIRHLPLIVKMQMTSRDTMPLDSHCIMLFMYYWLLLCEQ